jgi:hypothetical protein
MLTQGAWDRAAMPAKDIHHDLVHRLLVADGWRVTHDPYRIVVGRKNLFMDLGAEKLIAANRDGKRVAVEVKSFEGQSEVHDLEVALGQYLLYLPFLRAQEADRQLYLAIPGEVWKNVFEEPIGQGLLAECHLRLFIFDPLKEVILQWLPIP